MDTDIIGVIAATTGVLALAVSLVFNFYAIMCNRYQALVEYYSLDRDLEFIEAREKVYSAKNIKEIRKSKEVSQVMSMFHFYGLMVKKGYLPFYIFKSASGVAVIRLYEKLRPLVIERRKDNKYYAEYFEWLYEKIKKNELRKR